MSEVIWNFTEVARSRLWLSHGSRAQRMGGGLTKAAIAMVDDDPALTAVIREALPQTVALLQPGGAAST